MRSAKPHVFHIARDLSVPLAAGHVFTLAKYRLTAEALRSRGVPEESFERHGPIPWEDLARVHSADYLEDLRAGRHNARTIASEIDLNVAIVGAFRSMTAATVAAARDALSLGYAANLGGGFHHAFRDRPEGFCYLNDIAVAIEALRADGLARRPAVVDCDVHQGNGTAAIFRGDHDVFTLSIHQENNYPPKQPGSLDIGLDDGAGDDEYLSALGEGLSTLLERHPPDLVCYVAGADTYAHDHLGGLRVTKEGHARRDRLVLDAFGGRGIPLFTVLAGGYARVLADTVDIYAQTCWDIWSRAQERR